MTIKLATFTEWMQNRESLYLRNDACYLYAEDVADI